MAKALYRKYRSKNLDEVVGQDHITTTLKNSLASGKISHAYLLSGPRGVGKTSVARILAYEVNNLPYDENNIHLDIIEIDAASNRRIEEIRDLRDKVHIAPTSAKYKVYIIDEAHMLTKEAFNALLKTLEEPPEHCIFILATTEPHKLPETIISRTQRFNFKTVDTEEVSNHLKKLAVQEKIDITDEALAMLAEYGHGSFRDSISLLDQLRGFGKQIGTDDVENLLGIPSKKRINDLATALDSGSLNDVSSTLSALKQDGYDSTIVARLLVEEVRAQYLNNPGQNSQAKLKFLKTLIKTPSSHNPDEFLELSCLEYASKYLNNVSIINNNDPLVKSSKSNKNIDVTNHVVSEPKSTKHAFNIDGWHEVLTEVKKNSQGLYAALRLASPELKNNKLLLKFNFNLHRQKASSTENKKILGSALKQITSSPPEVEYHVDKSAAPNSDKVSLNAGPNFNKESSSTNLDTISNIFGSAEVLES